MGRARGTRNAGFDEKRAELCRRIVPFLYEHGRPATLKRMAQGADVSVPTLRHYFGDRDAVVKAVLVQAHLDMQPVLHSDVAADRPFAESLREALLGFVTAWRHTPFRALFLGALTAGFENETVGQTTVREFLEPSLQAFERRLDAAVARGVLAPTNARHTALMLLSSLLVALLHQDELGGASCRPLDVEALVDDLVARVCGVDTPPAARGA